MPSLSSLDPGFRPMAEAFFTWANQLHPDLVVTSARRTRAEQERLYRAAQAGQNDGLPATPPGSSSHELGLAWDMARLSVPALTDPVLRALGAAWKARGGVWWEGDPVHFAAPGRGQQAALPRPSTRSRQRLGKLARGLARKASRPTSTHRRSEAWPSWARLSRIGGRF